jgi:hypothetical protein
VRFSEYKMLAEHKQTLQKVGTATLATSACNWLRFVVRQVGSTFTYAAVVQRQRMLMVHETTTYGTILASPCKNARASFQKQYMSRILQVPCLSLGVHLGAIGPLYCRHCHTCSSTGPGWSAQTRQHCSTLRTLRCYQWRPCSCQRCG